MKGMIAILALGAIATTAVPVLAQTRVNATVVARDANGRATKVSVDGTEYAVCTASVKDACINPREAGLNFGNVPLDHWPGQTGTQRRS
jgi:hypothetical protein